MENLYPAINPVLLNPRPHGTPEVKMLQTTRSSDLVASDWLVAL